MPRALADYVERNGIAEVFIACSTPYVSVLTRENYGTATVHWCIPRVRPGGGPSVESSAQAGG